MKTSALSVSLKGRGHGSLLGQSLGVQGLGEGRGLVRVGGHYGGTVGDGVRRGADVAGGGLQVLPCEQVGLAAREVPAQGTQGQHGLLVTHTTHAGLVRAEDTLVKDTDTLQLMSSIILTGGTALSEDLLNFHLSFKIISPERFSLSHYCHFC
ncbi:hypothetical protein NL108_006150 [Boleophthalmus pectinirostris]|nr:hypothetical protein NL108_006150 [Boleophthalmus pectinirostris]